MKTFFRTLLALILAAFFITIYAAPASATEACTPVLDEGWYTESDDAAPTLTETGLLFTAPGGQAVGLRYETSFPLAELTGQGYTDVFHDRAVLDADGEPFGASNWRNDYTSLTFLTTDTVYVSGLNIVMTLDEVKATYTGTITSFGYHMDSNAAAGTEAFIEDHVTCEAVVVPPTEEPVVTEPPVVVEPTIVEPIVPIAEAEPTLAETGVREDLIVTLTILVAAFGAVGGLAIFASRRAHARG